MTEIIKKLTKVEFSKRLTVGINIAYWLLVFIMVALIFFNPIAGGSLVAVLGIVTPIIIANNGFYYNKSKAENLLKIGNSTDTTITDNSTDNSTPTI